MEKKLRIGFLSLYAFYGVILTLYLIAGIATIAKNEDFMGVFVVIFTAINIVCVIINGIYEIHGRENRNSMIFINLPLLGILINNLYLMIPSLFNGGSLVFPIFIFVLEGILAIYLFIPLILRNRIYNERVIYYIEMPISILLVLISVFLIATQLNSQFTVSTILAYVSTLIFGLALLLLQFLSSLFVNDNKKELQ